MEPQKYILKEHSVGELLYMPDRSGNWLILAAFWVPWTGIMQSVARDHNFLICVFLLRATKFRCSSAIYLSYFLFVLCCWKFARLSCASFVHIRITLLCVLVVVVQVAAFELRLATCNLPLGVLGTCSLILFLNKNPGTVSSNDEVIVGARSSSAGEGGEGVSAKGFASARTTHRATRIERAAVTSSRAPLCAFLGVIKIAKFIKAIITRAIKKQHKRKIRDDDVG